MKNVLEFKNKRKIEENFKKDAELKGYMDLFSGEKMLIIENTPENILCFKEDTQEVLKQRPYTVICFDVESKRKILESNCASELFTYLKID